MSLRRLTATVGLIGLIAVGCSDDKSSNATSATTDAPITTDQPDSTAAVTSTAAPTTTEVVPQAVPNGQPLGVGVAYRVPRSSVLGMYVQFTNTVEGGTSMAGPGGFVVAADANVSEILLSVADLSSVRLFTDPLVDALTLGGFGSLTAGSTEPPDDFFAYFSALPGVEAGDITDAEIAGHPAKAMTWEFGEFDGFPCAQAPLCMNVGWLGGWGISSYWAGNSGTTYLIDLDGEQVIVEVRDLPGAQEVADSLVISD